MHNIFIKSRVIYIYIYGYIYMYAFADKSLSYFIFYLTHILIYKKKKFFTVPVMLHVECITFFYIKLKAFIFMVMDRAFAVPSLCLPLFLDIWKTCTFKREKIPNKNFIDTTQKSSWWFLWGWPDVAQTQRSDFFMDNVESFIHEYTRTDKHIPLCADWLSCL